MSRQRSRGRCYSSFVNDQQQPTPRPVDQRYTQKNSHCWFCSILIGLLILGAIYYIVYVRSQVTSKGKPAKLGVDKSSAFRQGAQVQRLHSVCNTQVCLSISAALNQTLNRSVNPCEDFYGFVCDGWRKRHPPEEVRVKVSPFSMLASKIATSMRRGIYDSSQHWGKESLRRPVTVGETNSSSGGPSAQVAIFHRVCQSSVKEGEEVKSRKYLRRLLGQVGLTTLLSTDEVSKYDEEVIPNTAVETMVRLSFTWGLPSLMMIYPMADPTATNKNILVISSSDRQNKGALRNAKPFVIDETLDSYFEPAARALPDFTAKLLHNSRLEVQKLSRLVKTVAELLNIAGEKARTSGEINTIAKDIVMASLILDDAKNETNSLLEKLADSPKRMKFHDLHYMTGHNSIDLLALINKYAYDYNKLTFDSDDDVIVDSPRSLALLFMLLNNKETEHAIKNYVTYSLIGILAPFVGRDARRRSSVLAQALGTSTPNYHIDRWCDIQAQEFLPLSYGAVFVREMLDPSVKADAQLVVDYVKVAFVEAMRENVWMDRTTQLRAMGKLSEMMAHVGFPDWFEDGLERFVEAPDLSSGSLFLEAVLGIKQNRISLALKGFRNANVRDVNSWNFSPASLNAFYEHARNSITIPAAVLLFPFYTKGAPAAFNYGSLGSIIGHEISHGFDTIGSNFDEQGNYIGWWSGRTKKKFDDRNSCFVKQYEQLQNDILADVDESEIKKLNINSKQSRGQRTLPENLADNAGLRQAFRAYKYYTRDHPTDVVLPGLEFTPDQLFFIGNAYKWCANIEARHGELMSLKDAHATERLRCNAATMNIATFQETFSCPAGSSMAPENRCITW